MVANDHERSRESKVLQPKTTGKSIGFNSFNALLETQVNEGINTVKGTFTNLANS
jgi:hypothetical protein